MKTPPPNTPPLESSPAFQERAVTALGGTPTNPTQFRQAARPGKPITAATIPTTKAPKPEVIKNVTPPLPPRSQNITFDDDPTAAEHRAAIGKARQSIGNLIRLADNTTGILNSITEHLNTKTGGKSEAKRQGFDIKQVEAFTKDMDALISKYKPRQENEKSGNKKPEIKKPKAKTS